MREFMRIVENELNEVKMIDDFGDEGYQMERVFNRWTVQGADGVVVGNINGYDIHEKDGGTDRTFLFLFKDGECAGRATVDVARGMENTVKVARSGRSLRAAMWSGHWRSTAA